VHELITVHSFSINDRDYQPPAVAARLGSAHVVGSAVTPPNYATSINGQMVASHRTNGSLDGGSDGLATQ